MNEKDPKLRRLCEIIEEESVLHGRFKTSAGLETDVYFDLKKSLSSSEGASLTGYLVSDLLISTEIKSVGGYGLGSSIITTVTILTAYRRGKSLNGFEVIERKKLRIGDPEREGIDEYVIKGHIPSAGNEVAVVDDVITTGRAIFITITEVEKRGYKVGKVIVLVDRHQGGSDELKRRGYDFTALLSGDSEGHIIIN